ncbi:hypothetical protein FRC20_011270 [Serendipita sp. 405]|nr:hypothetical protein FRC16_010366 [Serendipita sp. 398]KAG8862342.1 hypothetical protein FRC20_011270 [Serendipita sp. 405]
MQSGMNTHPPGPFQVATRSGGDDMVSPDNFILQYSLGSGLLGTTRAFTLLIELSFSSFCNLRPRPRPRPRPRTFWEEIALSSNLLGSQCFETVKLTRRRH